MHAAARRGAKLVGVLLLVGLLVVAGGVGYFAFTFGSADHTQFTLTAEEIPRNRIAKNATATLSAQEAAVVTEAYQNGSARTIAERLDLQGAYVERNGTYLRVRVASGPEVTRERPVLTIEQVNETDGDVVATDELPAADERAVELAYRAWTIRNTDRGSDSPPVRYVYESVPDAADSVFVPTQEVQYVQLQNRTFRVRVRTENVSLATTTYHLDHVAGTESAFVATLVRNVTGRLNESEAEPLDRAIANGSYVSRASTYEAAERPIRPVAAALGVDDPVDILYESEGEGTVVRYIRYDGQYYRVTLSGHTTAA